MLVSRNDAVSIVNRNKRSRIMEARKNIVAVLRRVFPSRPSYAGSFCMANLAGRRGAVPLCSGAGSFQASLLMLASLTVFVVAGFPFNLLGASSRPNVVLVITDDQGYGDLGCHGHPILETPNLDRLYQESVRLTDFHVDPTCSPTRSALMTGRYSTRTGVWHTIAGRSLLAPGERTIAEVLADHGYRTGHFGKWHLGDNYPLRPHDQGFDVALYNGGGGVTQTPDYWGNDYFDDTYYRNGQPVTFRGFCTDVWFDNALEFIERNRNRPFFAYITPNAAHGPFRAPEKYKEMYAEKGVENEARQGFYGMLTNIDDNMGRLMKKLETLNLANETILIFMTDNGSARGTYNAGLRASKGSHYEGGHRVPFFIRYPAGDIRGGRDVEEVTAHVDVLPTLAGLCDLPQPRSPRGPIDGDNLAALLKGNDADWPDRTLFVHSQRIQHPEKWRRAAVMTDHWRLLDKNKLYEITEDRGQRNNVAQKYPDVMTRLQNRYDAWWKSLRPRFDEYVRIVIGSKHESSARITAHDWHNPGSNTPWNQGQIKRMPEVNGWWAIDVSQRGRYRFTLRHQPPQAAKELEAKTARIKVGNREASKTVDTGATSVSFELELDKGPKRLQTWLKKGETSRGAFFVYVKRLD